MRINKSNINECDQEEYKHRGVRIKLRKFVFTDRDNCTLT